MPCGGIRLNTPVSLRDSHTGEAPTFTPRTSSSPCTRLCPQLGFSWTRRSTGLRMERTVGGRPGSFGLDWAACRHRTRSRCQRNTVSGRTGNRITPSASGARRCSNAARNARSGLVNRTFCPLG